jgi:hypothetical protein
MKLNDVDAEPDDSTLYTAKTPPETVAADFIDDLDPVNDTKHLSSSVPWPGSTFIIRNALSGHVITLREGQLVLAPLGGRDSIHWACIETKGWLGFRNTSSGKLLGHDINGKLRCSADYHLMWEYFCVRMTPEGGYVLLMTHWERLWHVGSKVEQGVEVLAKMGDGVNGGVVWEFVKV